MRDAALIVIEAVGLSLGLALVAWRVAGSVRVAGDARAHGWSRVASAGWALTALVYSPWYWWRARLERLPEIEAQAVLAYQAQAHRLATVTNLRCPLCNTEMVNVLALSGAGELAVAVPAHCPQCDFRLDTCRHCQHFLPSEDGLAGQKDFTTGRCKLYRAPQPVRQAYPRMAARLEAMGYETLSAPKVIVDSYVPLDECNGFALDLVRLRKSRVAWLDQRRVALLRLNIRLRKQGGGPGRWHA